MKYKDFKKCIASPLLSIDKEMANTLSDKQSGELFWKKITINAIINRTIRNTLAYPEFAKKYLSEKPKATMDKNLKHEQR